jgi:hypothetical protein
MIVSTTVLAGAGALASAWFAIIFLLLGEVEFAAALSAIALGFVITGVAAWWLPALPEDEGDPLTPAGD